MKSGASSLPLAVPSIHARGVYVIYDDGRPLVEAYDGPQIVGMDLHRRRSVLRSADVSLAWCPDPWFDLRERVPEW